MKEAIEAALNEDRKTRESHVEQVYVRNPLVNPVKICLNMIKTERETGAKKKIQKKEDTPNWIQKKKRNVKHKQSKIMSFNNDDRKRAVQTLKLEPVKGNWGRNGSSSLWSGMVTGLLDSGADDVVVSLEVAQALGTEIRKTTVKAYDAGGRELPIKGECDIFFQCLCEKHKNNKKVRKTSLIFETTNTPLLIPYSLARELGLMTRLCESEEARINTVRNVFAQTDDESEEEIEGTEIMGEKEKKSKPNVDHLSEEMKGMVEKYPETLKDDLYGASAFTNIPYTPIELDPTIKPISRTYVKNTPLHLRETSQGFIKDLLNQGIIEPQPEWTEWCSSGFFVSAKESTKPRFVVDFRNLNKAVKRAPYPFLSASHTAKLMPSYTKYLISGDLVKEYFQIPLPEEDQHLTTFLTEEGRYYFKKFPQGLSSSSDVFNRLTNQAFMEIKNGWFLKVVDDIIVFGKTKEECLRRFEEIIKMLQRHNIIMSVKKLQEGEVVAWCGMVVSVDGQTGAVSISPDPEHSRAIEEFP